MTKLFDYQLVEHYYRNRIEWEDGPGSLQNVVSDERIRVIRTWENRDEDFGRQLITDGFSGLRCNSPDGWHEYSYRLQRRSAEGGEWALVDFISPPEPDPDYVY